MKAIFTKTIAAIFIGLAAIAPSALFASNTNATVDCNDTNIPESVREAAGCLGSSDSLSSVIQGILNAVIGIIGVVAVIYIVIGGVNYMTSAGDAEKVRKAKNTIKYAVIGLVVVILSFIIVNWAIEAIWKATN